MSDPTRISRRRVLEAAAWGAGLVATGGVIGWLAAQYARRPHTPSAAAPGLGGRFVYDIEAFATIAPALLLYRETAAYPVSLRAPRRLTVLPDGDLLVAGDRALVRLGADGSVRATVSLPDEPQAAEAFEDGYVVAFRNSVAWLDAAGVVQARTESLPARAHLTALAVAAESVYAADAGTREVLRFAPDGRLLGRFGRIGSGDGTPGFVVPSPFFDILHGHEGLLWVINPGRHRVEAYTYDGRFELAWGTPGMATESFCGCCNPVHFAQAPDGRFFTSEKGLPRVKRYARDGAFEGAVAGPAQLSDDPKGDRLGLTDPHAGRAYDVACAEDGSVLVLDPTRRVVRRFTPLAPDAPEGDAL